MELIFYRLTIVLAALVFLIFGLLFGYQTKQYLDHSQAHSFARLAYLEQKERGMMTEHELAMPAALRPNYLNDADIEQFARAHSMSGMQIAAGIALGIPASMFGIFFGLRWILTGRTSRLSLRKTSAAK